MQGKRVYEWIELVYVLYNSLWPPILDILLLRLHGLCNNGLGTNAYEYDNNATMREQELIQKLEDATDEIEVLLGENEKLRKLSNELRFELSNNRNCKLSSLEQHPTNSLHENQEHEQEMLDAILNDQSRSCESESHDELAEAVACIGRKPPMSSASDSRPSKTAYVSRTFVVAIW